MAVYDLAHRLAKRLKESEEYKSYLEIRKKIMKNEKSKEMLQDFQKEQFKLQSKQMTGQELSDEEKEKFKNLSEIINLNQDVKKYMEAEQRISIMLNDLQRILFSELEIGIPEDNPKEEQTNNDD